MPNELKIKNKIKKVERNRTIQNMELKWALFTGFEQGSIKGRKSWVFRTAIKQQVSLDFKALYSKCICVV